MTSYSLTIAPQLPLWLIGPLVVLALLVLIGGVWRRARGIGWRLLFVIVLIAAMLNPVLERERRDPLNDIAVLVRDASPSQELGERATRRDTVATALLEQMSTLDGIDVREITIGENSDSGTLLFDDLEDLLSEIDRDRLAGIVALTDGQIHDAPSQGQGAGSIAGAPFHALITGEEGEFDRQVTIERAPSFSMVDEPVTVEVRLEELPVGDGEARTATIPAQVRIDGELVREVLLQAGRTQSIDLVLEKAGRGIIEISVPERPGELTTINNRAMHEVNGVRDRLRVLLISGEPYPGLRVWRNLLKADPAVDLVHFTILRPPEKQDGTPIQELALIAFPARELFELKLPEFDLIIFDRYSRRGLLPLVYLDNVAQYVEQGGALLEEIGRAHV